MWKKIGHAEAREICKIGVNDFIGRLFPNGPQLVKCTPEVTVTTPSIEPSRDHLDSAILEVENHTFVVLKHHFHQSTLFDPYSGPDGEHDEEPIKLDGVLESDFQALLDLLCPFSQRALSQDDWESVLKLATKWKMLALRRVAIDRLSAASLPPTKLVLLGREYGIVDWLRQGYITLATRQTALSGHEFESLGLQTSLELSQKGRRRFTSYKASSSVSYNVFGPSHYRMVDCNKSSDIGAGEMIMREFEAELREQKGSLDIVDRITLARVHGVREWLQAAYVDLVDRQEDITVEEAKRLGLETAIALCRVREKLPEGPEKTTMRLVESSWVQSAMTREINTIFRKEFEEVDTASLLYRDPLEKTGTDGDMAGHVSPRPMPGTPSPPPPSRKRQKGRR